VFRDQRSGQWCGWQALTPAAARRRWRWIWHPQRYPIKAASDLGNSLRLNLGRHREFPSCIVFSGPYLGILHWVAAQPAAADVTHRQFAIVTSRGFASHETFDVFFVSEPHCVDDRFDACA
jgi:hypothetical protein